MKILNKIICLVLLVGLTTIVYSKPWYNAGSNHFVPPTPTANFVIQQIALNGNSINAWFYNTGIFNQDLRVTNTPGFEWPLGAGTFACFTAGWSMGAYVNGTLLEAMCSYKGEYGNGYIDNSSGNPVAMTDSRFRIYKVSATDDNSNPDFASWSDMVPWGAPYVDVNNNGQYDPGIDKPGIKDASQTLFGVMTDGFADRHQVGEGFGGGSAPMFSELHFTCWCYNTPGLESMQFVNWVIINKNKYPWEHTYMGITCDPDLGCANDDYIGCDTSGSFLGKPRNLGYVYNGEDVDCSGSYRYDGVVPCFGMDYFRSPIYQTNNPNDSVVYYIPPGSNHKVVKNGWKELGLTSFDYFVNNSTPSEDCVHDPNGEFVPAYYLLQGIKKDQTPWVVPPGASASLVTKFCYPGDPETGNGWTEGLPGNPTGAVWNCGGPGHYTGDVHSPNAYGDRRYIFNSGSDNFTVYPGDTQNVIMVQMVAKGSSRLNSVTVLKRSDDVAQKIFDGNFNVIPPPPPPKVKISANQLTTRGNYALTLSWTDTSEYYKFWDTLFAQPGDSSFYKFEGYEVWEVRRTSTSLPDLSKPETINTDIKLLAIFDKIDSMGIINDTFQTGNSSYGVFPVVPPYTMAVPSGFPNTGLSRSLTLTSTNYPAENNNSNDLIYGHDYKFIVTAYAYNTHQKQRGQAIIRNSIVSQVFTVHIEAPIAGTQYFFHNGDTLFNNRRDLGVTPIIKGQEYLQDAKYRIQFNSPDTTYNIYRFLNYGTNQETIKSNLKFSYNTNQAADDSSRIVDGILFKVVKLNETGNAQTGYTGNIGVVQDPTSSTYQTRQYGWSYEPSGNRYIEGSKYLYNPIKVWQSTSMALSYPNKSTYTGFASQSNPEDLRNVQLIFTDTSDGQYAYRFLANGDEYPLLYYTYQDMRKVPFTAWEIDSTDASPLRRQLNVAFLEFPDTAGGHPDGRWQPYADSLGGLEILYIWSNNYSSTPDPVLITKNLLLNQNQFPILYVWAPKLISPGAKYQIGDKFTIYPYMTTRPYIDISAQIPLYYDVFSKKPIVGNTSIASSNNDLNKITVVPNPYYGFNALETQQSGHYVAFRRLPVNCSIKIYTLNGDLIQTLNKNDATTSELRWNMMTFNNVPVASGMYIALIDCPGIGQKILKLAIFTVEERIDF